MSGAPDPELSLLDHLEELRRRLKACVVLLLLGAAAAGLLFKPAADAVRAQLGEAYAAAGHPEDFPKALVSLTPTDVVALIFKFALAGGVLLALPLLLVQVWGFVSPALRGTERKVAGWVIWAGPPCFLLGFLFGFTQIMPVASACMLEISYYYGFTPQWTAESYFGFFLVLNLLFGLFFELPLLMMILSAFGLAGPSTFARFRRHWIVASFVIGGVLPPAEVFSMLLQATTLIVLYEVGILLSRLFVRRQGPAQA